MKFSKSKFKTLSEISRDVGQVFFASVVISPLVAGIDAQSWLMVSLGMIGSLVFWWFSLVFAERSKL